MNVPFTIKLSLQTLLVGGNQPISGAVARLHSDALGGDWKTAHDTLPFALENGVECCSMPFYQSYPDPQFNFAQAEKGEKQELGVYAGQMVGFAAKLFPHDIDTTLIESNTNSGSWQYGTARQRDCGNVLSHYPSRIAQDIWFFGVTDNPNLLEKYVYQLSAIGKKHGVGFGALDASRTQVYMNEGKTNGIVDAKGKPLRPIPVSSKIKVKKDSIVADVGYKPAFWNISNRAACYIPSRHEQIKTFDQIDEEFL